MSMDKTYNSMDIKKALHAVDVPIPSESAFRYAKYYKVSHGLGRPRQKYKGGSK